MTDALLLRSTEWVEQALAQALARISVPGPSDGPEGAHVLPPRLLEAMRYAVLSPGKRLRPALVRGAVEAVRGQVDDALPAACAVEMVHAYSLVHDDLPILDDDDLRRGLPSCHRKFDEPTALLAGDALLTEAFALLVDPRPLGAGRPLSDAQRAACALELARSIGGAGMVGGQYDDVTLGDDTAPERLVSIHRRKTGRLIQASVALGALSAGAEPAALNRLRAFGADLGYAFQLVDDALDDDGLARTWGAAAVREEAARVTARALAALEPFEAAATPLAQVAKQMAERLK